MSNIPGRQAFPWHQAAPYMPGMMSMPNNPEMGQLMSLFAGQVLGPMFGPENFLPHLTAGSMGVMDQYAMRHFQQQQYMSAQAIGTANNQNVAARLLALRTIGTDGPATETMKNQAAYGASIINNPFVKGIVGQMVGPETLEAVMHGTKGDVAQLHSSTMRMGYYMRDPSGKRRMDAQSMEDFSRGVYAHLYEEGGDFNQLEQDALFGDTDAVKQEGRRRLKKAARIADDVDVITDADFMGRVDPTNIAMSDKIDQVYKKYVQGDEKDTTKQAEAIAKIQPAVKETGLLGEKEMLLSQVRKEAEKMQVAEMHGLMAGQVGQLQEYMMQRGMLPKAVGAMAPADRVKLMGGKLDDATITRLATTEAERDLMLNNETYQKADLTTQQKMVQERLTDYKKDIETTSQAIQDFNAGKGGSVEELEKMGGFEAIAGNVDSQRTASSLKKYSGAIDAVREIFGDNGNPNAPMPALLAALDHLTQGANFQMDAKGVETALRKMQMAAKEAGIGFEQMAAMSAQMGAMGDMLGLSPVAVMQGQVNAMAMMKTMREDGVFSKPRFGGFSQGEAQQFVAQKIVQGDASDNAKTMAAAASIYKTGKDSFDPNSEFAAAMEAYIAGNNTYTFGEGADRKTVDLFELVGREGPAAITRMFTNAGGNADELMAAFRSPIAQEFLRAGAGMQTQKYEAMRDINNFAMGGLMTSQIQDFTESTAGTLLGQQNAGTVGNVAGNAVTEMLVETADMSSEDQMSFIARELPGQLKESFKTQFNLDDKAAQQMAEEAASAIIGTVDTNAPEAEQKKQRAEQNRRIHRLRSEADTIISYMSGGELNLRRFADIFADDRVDRAVEETQGYERAATRRAETGLGYKSHPLARVSDYALEAGMTGEKFSFGRAMSEFLNVVPNKELAQRYIRGMEGGLDAANTRLSEITYTDKYLDELAAKADKGDRAADDELTALAEKAGMTPDDIAKLKVESQATYNARGKAAADKILASNDEDAVRQAYLAATGNKSTGLSVAKMKESLRNDKDVAAKFQQQQAQNAFLRERAKESTALDSPEAVRREYAKEFGEDALKKAGGTNANIEQLKEQLINSDYGVREGAKMAETSNVVTRAQLAERISKSDSVVGRLREDAAASGATEKEVAFLTSFNAGAFGAADEGIRKDVIRKFIDAYGMEDTVVGDDLNSDQELDALLKNTDPDDEEAKTKLAEHVRTAMLHGKDAKDVDPAAIERAQKMAETLRVGTAIDPAGQGINDIGDINTKDATINAAGGTIVIQGATIQQGPGATGSPPNASGVPTTPGAAPTAENKTEKTWLQRGLDWLTGQTDTPEPAAPQQKNEAAPDAAPPGATPRRPFSPAAATQDAEPQQDKPLVPPVPVPAANDVAAAQAEQTYGSVPTKSKQKTVYDLTPQDLQDQIGTGTEAQQQELLQSVGLLKSLKKIKQAGGLGEDFDADEEFDVKMQAAVASRLLPRPVDVFGDPLDDYASYAGEGIEAAEKHLQKYLPPPEASDAPPAAEPKVKPLGGYKASNRDTFGSDEVSFTPALTKEEQAQRLHELAAASGIKMGASNSYKFRGSVPTEINGQAVDFNHMTDRELTLLGGAIKMSHAMADAGGEPIDQAEVEQLEKIRAIQETRAREKAAAEQVEQNYGTDTPVQDKSAPPTTPQQKKEAHADRAAASKRDDKQFVGNVKKLQTRLESGDRAAQLEAASLLAGRYVPPEMLAAADISLNAAAQAEQPAGAALPGGVSSANVVQKSANAARQATEVAANTEQTPRPTAAGAAGGKESGPMEVVGELSIVNLEKAVLAVHNKSGRVEQTAGGVPIVG